MLKQPISFQPKDSLDKSSHKNNSSLQNKGQSVEIEDDYARPIKKQENYPMVAKYLDETKCINELY